MDENILLEARGLCASARGVPVLRNIHLSLRRGEIHGLLGKSGAGKTALFKCLSGRYPVDAGEIEFQSRFSSAGVALVSRENRLCLNLTTGENLFLGREPLTRFGWIDKKLLYHQAEEVLNRLEIPADAFQAAGEYPGYIRQMIEIARAVVQGHVILLLDHPEPGPGIRLLKNLLNRLAETGAGILAATDIPEIACILCNRASDRITMIRDGEFIGEFPASAKADTLSGFMSGEFYDNHVKISRAKIRNAPPELEARGLSGPGGIRPFDLDIRQGEIVGLAGLYGGNDIARLLFGLDRARTGNILIRGAPVVIKTPRDAIRLGVGYLPDTRDSRDFYQNFGVFGNLSVGENISLAVRAKRRRDLTRKHQDEIAEKYIHTLGIRVSGPDIFARDLSALDEKKMILARWLAAESDLLILNEPFRGLDSKGRREILNFILRVAADGISILWISKSADELFQICHKILILRGGVLEEYPLDGNFFPPDSV